MRDTTISVSEVEKDALDEVRLVLYDTEEIPYGAVIYEIAGRVIEEKEERRI
jgi:hypothetical protein